MADRKFKRKVGINVTSENQKFFRCERCLGEREGKLKQRIELTGWFELSDEWKGETWRLCIDCRDAWYRWMGMPIDRWKKHGKVAKVV